MGLRNLWGQEALVGLGGTCGAGGYLGGQQILTGLGYLWGQEKLMGLGDILGTEALMGLRYLWG